MSKKHNFFVSSLKNIDEDEFLKEKKISVEQERKRRNMIRASLKAFKDNKEAGFSFFGIFEDYDAFDQMRPISIEIEQDFKDYIDSPDYCDDKANNPSHAKNNFMLPFYYGEKSISKYRLYYAIVLALFILNCEEDIDKRIFYTKLFDKLDFPDGLRRGDFLCDSYDLSDKVFWNEKGIVLVIMLYLALLFENKCDTKGYIEYEEPFKYNLAKSLKQIIPENNCEKSVVESLKYLKENQNMRLSHRAEIDKRIGGVRNLFFQGKKRIVKEVTFVMYTGSSFLNVPQAEGSVSGRLVTIEPAVLRYLEDGGKMRLILTDPFSSSADEAVYNKKLGNSNDEGQQTPFSLAFDMMRELKKHDNLEIKYTNIALPYSIMKVDFIDIYSDLNYIKTDLYSYGIKSNRGRLSSIVFEDGDPYPYNFLEKNIEYAYEQAYEISRDYITDITIIRRSDYENDRTKNRVYFSGQQAFDRERNGNVNNFLSNIEFGMSAYKETYTDEAHFHRTTNEHYMILKGAQTIVDKRNGKEYTAREGDVVFIPKLIPHETREDENTVILFAKSPFGGEKKNI